MLLRAGLSEPMHIALVAGAVIVFIQDQMGKCKFNENWLFNQNFSTWLRPVPANMYVARCSLCKKFFKLGTMGIKAVESHMRSMRHKRAKSSCQQTESFSQFCSTLVSPAPISTTETAAPHFRTLFGVTPTLKTEVLWENSSLESKKNELETCSVKCFQILILPIRLHAETASISKFVLVPYILERTM